MNRLFQQPVVSGQYGGAGGGGTVVTPSGLNIIAQYNKMRLKIDAALTDDLTSLEAQLAQHHPEPTA